MSRISTLIVSYNTRQALAVVLASLPKTTDIVVVDNNSTDGSALMVQQQFPHVKLLAWDKNRGFSAAINAAANLASGDAFLLLNPDTQILPNTWLHIEQALHQHTHAWAVGFRQINEAQKFQLACGPKPTLIRELLRCLVQRQLDNKNHRLENILDQWLSTSRQVGWVAGSSLLVWRHAFMKVGGFDENFFLFFEDIDFCIRLSKAGGHIYYDPSITVMHHRGLSAATTPTLAQQAYRNSQLLFWRKHQSVWTYPLIHAYVNLRRFFKHL